MPEDQEKAEILEQIIVENYEDLLGFAARLIENRELAQDAVQETFLIAQQKYDDMISSLSPRGWLYNTLKNVINNFNRQYRKLLKVTAPLENYDGSGNNPVSIAVNYRGIIDDESLKILIWTYCYGWEYKDIADKLGISLSACKKRIQRARESFKKALDKEI